MHIQIPYCMSRNEARLVLIMRPQLLSLAVCTSHKSSFRDVQSPDYGSKGWPPADGGICISSLLCIDSSSWV